MTDWNRRDFVRLAAALGLLPTGAARAFAQGGDDAGAANAAADATSALQLGEPMPYSFEMLIERARELASRPYVPEVSPYAAILDGMDYDAYQRIDFRRKNTLEANNGLAPIRFFHVGRYFKLPVNISLVENGQARRVIYDPKLFSIPEDSPAKQLPDDVGFAGFRITEPNSDRDWIAFLGAAYFRTSGQDDQFGLSARALAIDVAMPRPEEFPRFTDFFIGPSEIGGRVKIACLLDSPRIAGVLEMDCVKNGPIRMEIRSRYFARDAIERCGIAPLTSMFWYSETDRKRRDDWRPEIHDSDGLAIWTGAGERLWRPLNNPPQVMTSTFSGAAPKGFGLLQRDRDFDHYLDDAVFYDRRASTWIVPKNDWGPGAVQLVEIPTDDEIHDNIAAYWLSDKPVEKGDALAYDYTLWWAREQPDPPAVGTVAATRIGRGGITGQPRPADQTRFAVEFDGGALAALPREGEAAEAVQPVVSASRGTIVRANSYPLKVGTRWRAVFDLSVVGTEPVELRLFLRRGDETLTETWAYQFLPLVAAG